MEDDGQPTPLRPRYAKLPDPDSGATQLWFITCDEGWRVLDRVRADVRVDGGLAGRSATGQAVRPEPAPVTLQLCVSSYCGLPGG